MTHTTTDCRSCSFRCAGICDADPGRALRSAASTTRRAPAAGAMVQRHHTRLVAGLCRATGDLDAAQDLAQDVFLRALTTFDSVREDAEVTSWLYAQARARAAEYARTRTAVQDASAAEAAAVPVVDNDALRDLEVAEARRIITRLMKDAVLDPAERLAFLMHYAAGVPLQAVTYGMGLRNRSGAKATIVSAKRKLTRAARRWQSRAARQASMTP